MPVVISLFAAVAAAIVGFWAWIGHPVMMPVSPLSPGEKMYCVSYAPFRGAETPHNPNFVVPPERIDEDMRKLAQISRCVRTYSIELGLDRVPEIAGRHGLKVLQGIWISGKPERNRIEIEGAIALAERHPDVITGLIVGNETLLRGELSGPALAGIVRAVKDRVSVPVTYADVWEFWLRHPELLDAVDFITIHILPYWEDLPIPAEIAAAHVDSIKQRVARSFPGREILIGETGWPSAGRMREGALPSPANQARVIQEILAVSERAGYRVNVIEAFDQPWKRKPEGTVGGHWGFLTADSRDYKFQWGQPVSNHPFWLLQAIGGIVLAGLVFAAGWWKRDRGTPLSPGATGLRFVPVAIVALAAGSCAGWSIENLWLESLFAIDWARNGMLVALSIGLPIAAAMTISAGVPPPAFAQVFARGDEGRANGVRLALGVMIALTVVIAIQLSLSLVFDPRYRDFLFPPLTAAAVAAFLAAWATPSIKGRIGVAEIAGAIVLATSAVFIVVNETTTNWQAVWFCAAVAVLSFSLLRLRDARS